jgi:hypothetical protein
MFRITSSNNRKRKPSPGPLLDNHVHASLRYIPPTQLQKEMQDYMKINIFSEENIIKKPIQDVPSINDKIISES